MVKKLLFLTIVLAWSASPTLAQRRPRDGAVAGGIAGAIIGGIVGHQNDETPEGIVIGGALGALAGGLAERASENEARLRYQRQQYYQQQRALQISQAVSLNDAIQMSRSGINPNLIIQQIRTNGVQQRIGVQEVIALHDNGVSDMVIQEMQNAPVAGSVSATVARQTYGPRPAYGPPPAIVIERRPQIILETYPQHIHGHYHHPPHWGYGPYCH